MATVKQNIYTVIKNEDAAKYLTKEEQAQLKSMLDKIANGRKTSGKKSVNTYLVCNTDEPYASEVQSVILKGEDAKQ